MNCINLNINGSNPLVLALNDILEFVMEGLG